MQAFAYMVFSVQSLIALLHDCAYFIYTVFLRIVPVGTINFRSRMMLVLFEGRYYLRAGAINLTRTCVRKFRCLFEYPHMHM